jgi:uncharacterized protein
MTRIALPTIPRAKLERIDSIYAKLPKLDCKGLCQECCGPINMSRLEWHRIVRRLGFDPEPTQDQINDLRCPMLTTQGKCSVYGIRPLICRLWGILRPTPIVPARSRRGTA